MSDQRPEDYAYSAPASAVALEPARPRDAAKLLVVDRRSKDTMATIFRRLGDYLPPRSVLVLNDTKVYPARLRVTKPTGGRVELLCLGFHGRSITALADRRLEDGWKLAVLGGGTLTVLRRRGSVYTLSSSISLVAIRKLLTTTGKTPLPPYLRHSPLTEGERRRWYQSVFAKTSGSVAAPTASLHFTSRLLRELKRRKIQIEYLTLHVGLGTFAPLTSEQLASGRLHHEEYMISAAVAKRLMKAKRDGRPIIAVGTTAARALEAATKRGRVQPGQRKTDIFIRPGYRWQMIDGLITNFHVPESSLMMLVAALIGRSRLLALYRLALKRKFRFFSFGDAMLII